MIFEPGDRVAIADRSYDVFGEHVTVVRADPLETTQHIRVRFDGAPEHETVWFYARELRHLDVVERLGELA